MANLTKVIPVRVTDEEKALFKSRAEASNLGVSEWFRALGHDAVRPIRSVAPKTGPSPTTPSINETINMMVGASSRVKPVLKVRPFTPCPKRGKK